MGSHAPRARLLPVAIILGLLALQVVARYRWGFLFGDEWQALHILIGFAVCFGVMALFHGAGVLRRIRRDTWFILASGLGCFLLFWYFGRMDAWARHWEPLVAAAGGGAGTWAPLYAFMYFATCAFVFRAVLPFAGARAAFGLRLGDLGLRARANPHRAEVRRVWIVYLLLFLGVLPFLFIAAQQGAFQAKYPLCRAMISPEGGIALEHFLVYQGFYFLIFLSGESFWRGYLTFGTERDLGFYGLCLMVVPYVTAHFGKPLPETLGAIAAGLVLGLLALKHRSVWLGVALHYAVAVTMDLLAIVANGFVIYWE